ncbi:Cof-type HAD-IIB family hydrolase [Neobacillus sp.]|uniref:Cof-type HAD-IIB family hydrolase n=1 Tax=Neobacillus sp. TaxID=2675273 RepID=UPI0028A1F00A|nr:Cof-type HAD-IIB family hydrolase [Neobacillus sp.]
MKYKLICIDMDGTLLNNKFTIPDENIRALKEAMEKGVKIALVTGRPFNIASYFKRFLGDDVLTVGTNGTYYKYGEVLYKKTLSADEIETIYNIVEKHKLTAYFKGHNIVLSNEKIPENHQYKMIDTYLNDEEKMNLFDNCSLQFTLENHNENICKCIVFSDDTEAVNKAKQELKQYNILEVVSSHVNNFEAMQLGTSKGIAVKSLCDNLNVKPEELICIGDNENDLSMLQFAGLGIAMGNAPEEIKLQADYVTDNNVNCGVAKALDLFLK